MNKKRFSTLILMPYFPIDGYINLNGIKLWSYKNLKNNFIKNDTLLKHIDKLVSCYKFHNGKSIENPTILSINNFSFANPTSKSIKKIEAIKNILLLSSVLKINQWSIVTSDNFEVVYQRFIVGEEGLSTNSGAIHRISTGGYKITDLSFIKPEHVIMPFKSKFDGRVISALANCLINSSKNHTMNQIILSLSSFFNAYRNSHEISLPSRILSMLVAFELLFGSSSRDNFRNNIEKYCFFKSPFPSSKAYRYPIIHTKTNNVIRHEDLTLRQVWAEEFYKLRHKIIHGHIVYDSDFYLIDLMNLIKKSEPHFYIAVNFYIVAVLSKLRELGFTSVPHLIINPTTNKSLFNLNISGIVNEIFKIEDVGMYAYLRDLPPTK